MCVLPTRVPPLWGWAIYCRRQVVCCWESFSGVHTGFRHQSCVVKAPLQMVCGSAFYRNDDDNKKKNSVFISIFGGI